MRVTKEKIVYTDICSVTYFVEHEWRYLTALHPITLCSKPSRSIEKVVFYYYKLI